MLVVSSALTLCAGCCRVAVSKSRRKKNRQSVVMNRCDSAGVAIAVITYNGGILFGHHGHDVCSIALFWSTCSYC